MIGKLVVIKTVRATPTAPTDVHAMALNGNVANQKWTDIALREDINQIENVLKKILKSFQNVLDFVKTLLSTVSMVVKKVTMDSTAEKNVEIRNELANKHVHVTNNVQRAVHALAGVRTSMHDHAMSFMLKKLHVAKVNAIPSLLIAKLLAVASTNKSVKVNVFMIMLIALLVVLAIKTANTVVLATMTILLIILIAVVITIHHHQKQINVESYGAMRWTLVELIAQQKHINVSLTVMVMQLVKPHAVKTMPSVLADVHVTQSVQMAVHVQFGMICQTSAQ